MAMRACFYFTLFFLSLSHSVLRAQTLNFEVLVKEQTTNLPLEGIKVACEFKQGQKMSYTESDGMAEFSVPEKPNYLRFTLEDPQKIYYARSEYLEKSEIKGLTTRTIYLTKIGDFSLVLAEFRMIDAKIDAKLRATSADATVYDGKHGACDSLIEASFAGGEGAMQRFISENVNYPQAAIELFQQGKVEMRAIIEADGQLGHVSIEQSAGFDLDYEAVRLLYAMPRWLPATCQGTPVRSVMRIPVNFKLD
jgi:TonB family protein